MGSDVVCSDLKTGQTTLVSGLHGRPANANVGAGNWSSNGRCLAFGSDATNLVPRDSPYEDIFIECR
jgi:hypothetical protein